MTTLPAYPVSKVGRSGLANITCGHDYAILEQITSDY